MSAIIWPLRGMEELEELFICAFVNSELLYIYRISLL